DDGDDDPSTPHLDVVEPDREPDPENERPETAGADNRGPHVRHRSHRHCGPRRVDATGCHDEVPEEGHRSRECEGAQEVEREEPAGEGHGKSHGAAAYGSRNADANEDRRLRRPPRPATITARGYDRTSPAPPDRDDRGGELVARPPRGARPR